MLCCPPGVLPYRVVRCGAARCGAMRAVRAVRRNAARCGAMRRDAARCGCDVVWCGILPHRAVRCCAMRERLTPSCARARPTRFSNGPRVRHRSPSPLSPTYPVPCLFSIIFFNTIRHTPALSLVFLFFFPTPAHTSTSPSVPAVPRPSRP